MRITKARYVTICQQMLVTAMVVVVGLSAAGVMTLQIVDPAAPSGERASAADLAPAITISDGYADRAPVTPQVREVAVRGIDPEAAREIPGVVAEPEAGETSGPEAGARAAKAPRKLAALSKPTPVKGFATVGVTWEPGTTLEEDQIAVQVRTRTGDTWSDWTPAEYHDEHGPDAGSAEAARVRPGTEPVVVGDVDEVQMKAETATGEVPEGLELAVVDPGAGKVVKQAPEIDTAALPSGQSAESGAATAESPATAEADSGSEEAAVAALSAMKVAPKPTIYSRAQWGANERLRDKSSLRYGTIRTGFIHHTVNANSYSSSQVPALIRGIYAYHTQSRGWSDIGYNFLVDRFGRIWEGRYGGVDRAVIGAHTLGYNEYSFAMSAIGNFDVAAPPQAVLDAYARLFAWKLSLANIRATATGIVLKKKTFRAINGHRDAGSTACPGRYLYAKLATIRTAAQTIQDKGLTPVDPVNQAPIAAPAGVPSPTQAPGAAVAQPKMYFPVRTSLAGDGWPDLVTLSTSGRIQVVPTAGIRDYTTRVVSGGNWKGMDLVVALGDVTGDRRSDVLGRNARTKVARVFPGDGTGRVGAGVATTSVFAKLSWLTGARDFNRDGRNDAIGQSRRTGALQLFRGTGRGTFAKPIRLRKKWAFSHTTGVGDFNGDRSPDLVGAIGNSVYLIPGTGRSASLGRAVRLLTTSGKIGGLHGWGDLDGDRRPDLLVRSGGRTMLYSGTGTGRVGQVSGPFLQLNGLARASLAPMTGSGAADMVGRDAGGRLVTVVHNGRRNIGAALPSNLVLSGVSQVLNVGDWNRDGKGDIIVRLAAGDQLRLYPGLGNGKFGRPRALGAGWKPITQLAAVGDVTGDGHPDLLGKKAGGPMTIFRGAGNQAFLAPVLAPKALRTFNQVGRGSWSTAGGVLASAGGSFVPLAGTDPASALRMANGSATATYDSYLGVGDANGDLVADLLAREKGTGTLWLLPGKTSGGFAPRMWVAAGFAGYRSVG